MSSPARETIRFELDGVEVEAYAGETIWQVAKRHATDIPHLCYAHEPGYRADGNCRACMVEIEGERVLAASCIRMPTPGMKVTSNNARTEHARAMVMELLVADQPERVRAHDPDSHLWRWAERMSVTESRLPARPRAPAPDASHTAMRVNLDACIHCNLCVRACREVQVNDVIGMAYRGHGAKIVFDFDDAMGSSTCVACGECVQACPTGALMEASLVDEQGVGRRMALDEVHSVCPYCGVGCQITYQVNDNRIVAVQGRDGPANRQRLCVKGRFGFDYVSHPHRLTKPLIRRDDAPKSADCEVDPANPFTHFREASWEEALDAAAAGLKTIRDRDGSKAMAGFGSAKGSNEEAYLVQKLVRAGFGTNNVDHCTRLCHASSVVALLEGIGSGAVTAPFTACEDSDVIIITGSNATENHPVAATFFKQAAKTKTLIVMDPRGQQLNRHATHMLQFKPGTDVALLNAMLNVIVEEGLFDRQYVEANTEGFESLRHHIKDFTPEAMQEVCGIDAQTIRTVARKYATAERAIIFWGMGISQSVHGTDNARCLIALSMITGQVGRPGTGLHPLRGQNNVQGASDAGLIPMVFPDYQAVEMDGIRQRFEDAWGTSLDPVRGLTVVEIMDAVHAGVIKGIYIMGENPAMSDPDVDHAREALAKLEHLVVQDIFLTETAFHADVVLPASAWPEKDGTVTNTNRQVQMGRTALEMPGDARQDWWILQELARRIGLDWNYQSVADVFAEMKTVMPSLDNITWERLERESAVTYPCDAPDRPGNDIVFGSGFPTPDGRAKLVPASIIPPDEQPDNEYPMVLTTGRQLEHWHTGAMTRRATHLDALEPEAVASLSPGDLQRLGVAPGERVRVRTRRGAIELSARADDGIPAGMVFIPFCYAEAAANVLTNPALDPFGKIPEFKFCAAKVEAASGSEAA
ncbi:MAG: formate dehydrogenase subunit alpha [Gammaproteobacteria bacterium]|nr:formate dehydrogenase subunit alpha [Gammaproteobacteria bacterium]NIM72012.1 formate dehydrogenase subunit alpha [Gammaproteobacteria bacterium]NIN38420.1 formate dehydrogenase subunit alpha [Gammaproteobacteria bacterium]NIO23739.1 formate dehydrogenase subunit alpha [Gammaproteobacteria bacterium]NIO64381.1 formate dehydrogenase subunit alpha [Gammaproteobacteria bacterium]